jgi:hypothetical protein
MTARWCLLAVVGIAACGTSPPACPTDDPTSCPASGAPSYANDIVPIIQTYCNTSACHGPGGLSSSFPLATYSQIEGRISTVHEQVVDCLMPRAPGSDLTPADRVTLIDWIVCGSPNN